MGGLDVNRMAEQQTDLVNQPGERTSFPPGLHHAYLFSTFNAFSYQVVLNSPMVLYAKTLGASATVLGIIAGMMPLLVIFQIPAANHIPRFGFKRFVYAGWGTRVMFIFGMALVPLTGVFLKPETRLALMLMLLFGFNLSSRHLQLRLAAVDHRAGPGPVARQIPRPRRRRPEPGQLHHLPHRCRLPCRRARGRGSSPSSLPSAPSWAR